MSDEEINLKEARLKEIKVTCRLVTYLEHLKAKGEDSSETPVNPKKEFIFKSIERARQRILAKEEV